ncbi:glucans biosynthesis protein MdoC [Erwinia sp. MMLR14_017]|uniref:glucans biosynthesis protein MdoC n=1 Tax=Erwinia sp. MMLR14_017 TaxID=3093842 RepID=UPI00298F789A|nr:glucans biosynthesis protein MdoC [Erwinia sp. MMLR14_017]MDW8846642.1 glucans biosynthesis protein MdoC [Erwinia sp. MMLR14_017]
MTTKKQEREYFFDSIRAYLMLLGVPFHVSLIYSTQLWSVNSPAPSEWLTLLNDFIHAFRMQVFFVISGYFSYMLYLRYSSGEWLKVRLERVGIPMLAAIPLLTVPQFFMIKAWTSKIGDWHGFSLYQKFNALAWDLISHLWFLLVLVVLTTLGLWLFKWLRDGKGAKTEYSEVTWTKLTFAILLCALAWGAIRHLLFLYAPLMLSDGLFNYAVMQSLFFLPFFVLGALSWKYPALKALFVKPVPWTFIGSALAFVAYVLNQTYSKGEGWLYEIDAIVSMTMGLWMVNVVFSLGHRLLNSHSPRVTYLVNASLFIYLVHHPLTILYGIFLVPHITSNTLGFFTGLLFVFGIAFLLYEIHLRIPFLRFLFSGKPQR